LGDRIYQQSLTQSPAPRSVMLAAKQYAEHIRWIKIPADKLRDKCPEIQQEDDLDAMTLEDHETSMDRLNRIANALDIEKRSTNMTEKQWFTSRTSVLSAKNK
jgi:hypothetical protein